MSDYYATAFDENLNDYHTNSVPNSAAELTISILSGHPRSSVCSTSSGGSALIRTSNVIVRRKTEHGYQQLLREKFLSVDQNGRSEQDIPEDEWHEVLKREFGLSVPN